MKIIGITHQAHQLRINRLYLLIITIITICACGTTRNKQENNLIKYDDLTQQYVYILAEKMPSYIGGDSSFMSDFSKNFHYNYSQHLKEEIQTKLQVQFVINKKGNLIGARIYNKNTNELTEFEKAGLNALNLMQDWQAGMHNNKAVSVILTKIINVDMNK